MFKRSHWLVACTVLAVTGCKTAESEAEADQPTTEVPAPAPPAEPPASPPSQPPAAPPAEPSEPPAEPDPAPAPETPREQQEEVTEIEAYRFMQQASFGASAKEIEDLQQQGLANWFVEQTDAAYVPYQQRIVELHSEGWFSPDVITELFWERALHGEDQLRERMAYALSQIVVVSLTDPQVNRNRRSFTVYLDLLQREALGNYCTLIEDVSINPAMGLFLTHLGNRKADEVTGFVPDENYAREVMQLFTIGLETLGPDGRGLGEETYTADDVAGLAAVFTGLSWADTDFYRPRVNEFNQYLPMESFLAQHEDGPKSFLGTTVDVGSDAVLSVNEALRYLLAHPNVAPFVSKQLIQKLVTSNPSPAYVQRVAEAFESGEYLLPNGTRVGEGTRCDLTATAAAILFDEEARGEPTSDDYGKVRDPVLRLSSFLRSYRVERRVTSVGERPSGRMLGGLEDSDRLGINAFVAPSVFGFFRPGFVAPGTESADRDLVTPEYQIATTPALVGYINTMEDFIDGISNRSGDIPLIDIDLSGLDALADDPEALVAEVNRHLMGGLLTAPNAEAIEEAVGLIDISDSREERDRRRRVETALLMAVVSPEYIVQR